MRFKGLDLNLLVALDVLLTEKNVSRAADKLCLSQSATSGALARLREYFGDDLLVPVGRKMAVTPRGAQLADKVRAALMHIDGTIIQPAEFDPSTVERTIRIGASDYVVITRLTEAVRRISAQAPNLHFVFEAPQRDATQPLIRGEIDLLAMPEVFLSDAHPSAPYFSDEYVVVMWQGNQRFGETMSRKEIFEARHVSMKHASVAPSYEGWFMKQSGVERKVVATASSFTAMPFLLVGTDNIALLQSDLAKVFVEMMPLRIVPCPIPIPPLVERLQWHAFAEGDQCLTWVRKEILRGQQGA